MSQVANVGTSDFDAEVLQSSQPIMVDFWAEWCPPCKMLSPVVDKVAAKFNDRMKILKCNVDENQHLASQYGVTTIPNLMFFKDGQVVDQIVGYKNEAQLADKLDEVLAS